MAYRGSMEYSTDTFDDGLPSHVYYNAQIINNTSGDFDETGKAVQNPQIRFNETRDAALIKDASKYNYSIVRFTMNGPNLTLPVFIPNIAVGLTANPTQDPNLTTYSVSITLSQTWNVTIPTNGGLQAVTFEIAPTPTVIEYVSETQNTYIAPLPQPPLTQQDLGGSYYFCYSYQTVVNMFNTAFTEALRQAYNIFEIQWNDPLAVKGKPAGTITTPFPYSGFDTGANPFLNSPYGTMAPWMTYNPSNKLFTINYDSRAFGPRISNWAAQITDGTPVSPPVCRLFANNNTYGLFSNFPTNYWNSSTITGFNFAVQQGYVWEYLVPNQFFQNITNLGGTPYQGAAPLGYVPPSVTGYQGSLNPPGVGSAITVNYNQAPFWAVTQEYISIDSLWSPIGSIVFTTTLMPVKSEATGVPIVLGATNLGDSSASSQSAFVNSITDIALDTSADGGDAYRRFIYYAPAAQYRISDLANSKLDIRTIDVQVFFKNRLNNQLYPITMFNLSSVDFKMMFRHKRISEGKRA